MLGDDPDAADRWIDDWQEGFERRAAQARELSRRVAALTVTTSDRRGLVTVTVDSSGVVQDLRLDPGICERPAAEIAELVMTVIRWALAELTEKVTSATAETLGVDTEAGRAIVDSYTRRWVPPEDGRGDGRR